MSFFMSWRDIALFARSARTDATQRRLAGAQGARAAFETIYAADPDPWASADPRYRYQRQKYAGILAALPPGRRYARALDLGCGLGLLTERLAPRCDTVLGVDIAESALARAQARPAMPANVSFLQGDAEHLPAALEGSFDLIVIADTLYYLPPPLSDARLAAIADRVAAMLRPGGLCLLANHFFFRADPESRLSWRIHAQFRARLHRIAGRRRPFYLVDLLEHRP